MANLNEKAAAWRERAMRFVEHWRVRRPALDHLIRTIQRYQGQFGDRLAGAVTYFAFLSFFPLIALAYAIFGYVLTASPGVEQALKAEIAQQLPGLAGELNLDVIAQSKATAGIIGLLGLLYAGLGAIDALRGALREMSMTTTPPLNFFVGKLRDLTSLMLIGVTMLVSAGVSVLTSATAGRVAEWLGFQNDDLGARGMVWVTGIVATVLADWLLFMIILGWVARPTRPFRAVAQGALLGAIGFGLLKQLATLLLGYTLSNPLYGTFAVLVGLLVWINFSARLVLYVASWTATTGFAPPPSPTPLPSNGDAAG
ncbi:YihY/virulence factor BrkB family protein [Nonomuraea typhae]|uniref:YihY/virulence factor BrkB family protein n=1 Tax=Nonomuraea typhae TaxID=2603600 RepID=UPI0012F77C0C|nr:YihY/virulence factor BrkB family protein [Nonomuraea typhae]